MIKLILHNGRKSRSVALPETWNELNKAQLLLVTKALFSGKPDIEIRTMIAVILADMSVAELRQCAPEVMYEFLIPLGEFLATNCNLTKQLIPTIANPWGQDYHAPSAEFDNLRLGEYDAAEKELYLWVASLQKEDGKEPDYNQLWRFVATIYRQAAPEQKQQDDCRAPFDHSMVQHHANKLSKICKIETAMAIMLWYKGCRGYLATLYSELFASEEGSDTEEEYPDNFPLMRLIAKEGIYGDFDKVEQLYLHTALRELEENMKEVAAQEAQSDTNKFDD